MGRKLLKKFQIISYTLVINFLISQPTGIYAANKSNNKSHLKMEDNFFETWPSIIYPLDKVKTSTKKKAKKLKGKVCTWVKDKWWTENSSGGYDVKFTRTKVKYYNREDGEIHHIAKINGYQKIEGGFAIKVKFEQYKYCYAIYENQKDTLEYFIGWKVDGNQYSGSSSLSEGKWQ